MPFNKTMDEFNTTYMIKDKKFNSGNLNTMGDLIGDELVEFDGEFENLPIVKENFVKEAIDILYITSQQLRLMGVDVDAAFAEVHRSNMSKALPLDGSINVQKELEKVRERYPNAGVKEGQRYAVLICGDTQKVIKPEGCYSPAIITKEMVGE